MARFPRVDETFILREINELERHGQPVLVVPLLEERGPVIHEEAKPWVKRALYVPLLSATIVRSNIRALFRHPRRYATLLARLIAGTIVRPSTLLRTLALFPKAVHLAQALARMGIRHVHAHFATHATTMAYIISELSDITYSFTVHGPDVFVHRLLLREKIAKARFVRTVSTFNKAFLCGLYPVVCEGKIEVVHTGVNPDVYADSAKRARRRSERPQILSVAALSPSRGFAFLIDACAELVRSGVDVECTIVGGGPLRAATEEWVAQSGLDRAVRLLGNLPQHEVARLMGETDVFVLPSIIAMDGQMDGIPMSLMEAMAAGKPVVASAISGIPELVQHDVSGILVDAAYAHRLAAAVRRLLEDADLRLRLGREGEATVRREFDVRKTAAKLVALFDRYSGVNEVKLTTAEAIMSLAWSRLNVVAVGVRRVHERPDSYVAEVAITDGIRRRDVIVRRPRVADDGSPALERARAEFETITTLRQSMHPGADETRDGTTYTLPRLLMFDEANAALVLDRADGQSLASLIRETPARGFARRTAIALRRTGGWLRAMQSHTPSPKNGRDVLMTIAVIAQRELDLAAAADRVVRRQRDLIARRIQLLETRLAAKELQVTGHHGDYSPENIFIGERRIDVTGFANYREGLPLEDVARFLIEIELHCSRAVRRRHLRAFRAAFLEGYAETASIDDDALNLFSLTQALRLLARGGAHTATHNRLIHRVISRSLGA